MITGVNNLKIDKKWLTMELSPKTYGDLTGHSEDYVRKWCLPAEIRGKPDARIRVRVLTADIMDNQCERKAIWEEADTQMKMNESFGLNPYLKEIQRASMRNARIRDRRKQTDIPEDERLTAKMIGKLRGRGGPKTRNRWVTLAAEFSQAAMLSGDGRQEYACLQKIRKSLEMDIRKKKKEALQKREEILRDFT